MRFFYSLIIMLLMLQFTAVARSNGQQTLSIVPVKTLSVAAARLLIGGTIAAHKSVILSAQMPGRIVSIAGEEGDHFKTGNLLVKINDDELLTQRQSALSQFNTASIAMNNAGVQLHRQLVSPSTSNRAPGGMGIPGMFDQLLTNPMSEMMGTRDYGVERGADIFSSRAQLDQAHQALQQARANIYQIDSKLRDSMSIAPFDGVIVTKNIEVGDTVQPGQRLLIYEDLHQLQIHIDVPARIIHHLQKGQLLNARMDGAANKIEVKIAKIFPSSDPLRHTTRVKLTLPESSHAAPGNYAEVWIPTAKNTMKTHLLIPSSAVIQRGGVPSVFVVNQNQQVELRLARLGELLPSGDIVILYGVKENEQIIDKPPAFITSGYTIQQ
ncbi:MAG: efflux RND transporter periplasmic adaptor subunit [gamma proteobacterium symbiont of Taylorina sp.]|nr:efflux RND transporter periplasmic adaptor subunit [gamma proteobacterium symbiont of Taylorina sp.]